MNPEFTTHMARHEEVRIGSMIYGSIQEKGNKGTDSHRFELFVQVPESSTTVKGTFKTKKQARQAARDAFKV